MALAPGTRLGAYEVTGQIGAGGMGEVYRATDTNLHRSVAIKVLPESLRQDGDALARFEREAKTLAQLNHPHIATIHGVEKSPGVYALVMELVEGPTLADYLARGPLPVAEALAIANQIAEALEAAHSQGIVHRDLKPSNIMIRPDGKLKVLDFGLARSTARLPASTVSQPPTVTAPLTEAGLVLGTAAYMSPEQARGQAVDKRTDVWAFGCIVYEMLTGTAAFKGGSFSDVVASVLRQDPNWTALPLPAAPFRRVLERCLEKDVRLRLRDVGDVALLLDDAAVRPSHEGPAAGNRSSRGWWTAAAITGVIAGGGAVAIVNSLRSPAESEPVGRFQLSVPPDLPFSAQSDGQNAAISPEGSTIVYTSDRGGVPGLVVQGVGELQGRRLAGTDGARNPIFSPDGKEIAFTTFLELKRVAVAGGPASTIAPLGPMAGYFNGASWGPHGTLVYTLFSFGLFRVSASGGQPETIARPDAAKQENAFASPVALPDGQTVLYTVVMTDGSSRIAARRLGRQGVSTLIEDGFGPQYLPAGYLVFARGHRLMAVRFDAAALQVKGPPVVVEEGVFTKTADYTANTTVAANGTAAFVVGHDASKLNRVVWVDRHGNHVGALMKEPVEFPRNPRISPNGRKVVLTIGPPSNGQLWIYDVAGATPPIKLTFRDHGAFPVWSPDGKRIGFLWRTGSTASLSWIAADGTSTEPASIPSHETQPVVPLEWSPDAAYLLCQLTSVPAKITLVALGDGQARTWLATPFSDWAGRLSPNGRWMAYATDQTGALEIWVRPFPGPGAPVRISSAGGRLPLWSRDGKEIFFETGPQLFSARVTAEAPDFRAAAPEALFQGGFTRDDNDPGLRFMDVAPDGRFLMAEPVDGSASASIVLSPHWVSEVKRLAVR